ncbi:hypothetical protein F8C76_10195 [Flagellimonas olearia]|uniref:Uncharacterized protein n=1 Tax=Flagellimonas olearia TaxID=552546 RepID=A0A6I1DXY9_9FLAO|nr:hypothetical protein [Allomuricauda olearia]KAB7528232.1 hypothetical protein F8C76_10195 [Allomuricauda olearia]
MDAQQMFLKLEERALSGELIRTSSGGNHILKYSNNAENIHNGKCKRWIVHFVKDGELVAMCDYTKGIEPKFESWDVFDKENGIMEHKFTWVN